MADPIEILLQSLKPGTKTALDQAGYTPGTGAFVAPQVPLPQLSPTAQYVQDMQTLMQGGLGKLSTGEKIGALGQLLQAAGSRGAADPGAVIQNVRQQQMQKLNAQYQIAQLQQKAQQEQQKKAFIDQYADKMPDELKGLLANADLDTAFDIVKSRVAGNTQLFQILDGPEGNKVAVYSKPSGETLIVDTPIPNKVETAVIDQGVTKTLIHKDTGEVIETFNVNDLTPARVARIKKPTGGGGGSRSGGKSTGQPQYRTVDGKTGWYRWNPTQERYIPYTKGDLGTPASKSDFAKDFSTLLAPKKNQRMFGN